MAQPNGFGFDMIYYLIFTKDLAMEGNCSDIFGFSWSRATISSN